MRALVQRVAEAEVTVAGRSTGRIGPGLLVLVCAMQGDDAAAAEKLAARVARLRERGVVPGLGTVLVPPLMACREQSARGFFAGDSFQACAGRGISAGPRDG